MFPGATRASTSECVSLTGQEEYWHEPSALQEGNGGATVCPDGELDGWAGKKCCGLERLVKALGVNGLEGPRGNGSTRGRGGSLRSSVNPEAPEPFEPLRVLIDAC